jgi:CheY-like chemotaxis protein
MKELILPCCYFPTTIALIDDSQAFLDTLSLKLDKNLVFKTYNKSEQALESIQNISSSKNKIHTFLSEFSSNEIDINSVTDHLFHINTASFSQELYNSNRFSLLSVALIDFYMPTMNGRELCQQLIENPIKKIMLTGQADHREAVKLFNEGVIDVFIQKDTPTMYQEINIAIKKMQLDYFQQLSQGIMNTLSMKHNSALADSIFKNFFYDFYNNKGFAECYLLDIFGSFLFLDSKANPTWLIIKSEQELHEFCDIAIGKRAGSSIVDRIKKKEAMPILLNELDHMQPVAEWHRYLYPIKCLKGENNTYYYAIVDGRLIGNFDYAKIISYDAYLSKIQYQ